MTHPAPVVEPPKRPFVARALMLAIVLGAGLFVGVVAALLTATLGGRSESAYASQSATCNSAGSLYTIKLQGAGTTTNPDEMGIDANGYLEFKPSGGSWLACGAAAPTKVTITAPNGTTEALEIDESGTQGTSPVVDEPITSANCIPIDSSSVLTTNTGTAGTLIVRDAPGGDVEFGKTTIQLGTGCTTNLPGKLTAVQLIGNGIDTLSSNGVGTDPASTLPTTFTVGDPGSSNTETLKVGSASQTTIDFANAGQVYACSGTNCSLSINSSGSNQTHLPDGSTPIPSQIGGIALNDVAYLSSTTGTERYDFSASSTATAPTITNFEFSDNFTTGAGAYSGPTYIWGANGNFTVPSIPAISITPPAAYPATAQAPANSEFGVVGASTFNSSGAPGAASNTAFYCGTGTDSFFVTGGENVFYVGAGPDNLYDNGGTGNTVDFSGVVTSANSSGQLTVNTSGSAITVGSGNSTAQLANGAAALGTTTQYTFLDGLGQTTDNDFNVFNASNKGETQFVAGDTYGLKFAGYSSTNTDSVVFDTTDGIVANLGTLPESVNNVSLSSSVTGVSFGSQLTTGQVMVYNPAAGTHTGMDTLASVDSATLPSIFTVTGPAIGYSTFYSGDGTTAYSFTGGSGGNNIFNGASASLTFTSGGEGNKFIAGAGIETFAETTTVQNPSNTIDFSKLVNATGDSSGSTTRLVINVSGANLTVPDYGAGLITTPDGGSGGTLSSTKVYSFGTGGSQFNIIYGASTGYTTFEGGSGQYQYKGQGPASTNILDFSAVPNATASNLTLDTTPSTPQATLGGVPETFSNITDLIGLSGGSTIFVAGSQGGYIFQGNGTKNTAQFLSPAEINITNQTTAITDSSGNQIGANQALINPPTSTPFASCTSTTSISNSCIYMVDISSVAVGKSGTGGKFTIYVGPTSETFSDNGTGDSDTLDFSYVSTGGGTGLTVDVSGGPNSGTATVGSVSYIFTSGTSAFTNLVGPKSGLSNFVASPNSGYTYTANGSGNSIDFSAAASGVYVNYTGFATSGPNLNQALATVCFDGNACTKTDSITDITTVTGSSHGGNTFIAWGTDSPAADATTYSFTGLLNGNTFVGGAGGTETFVSNGTNNTFTAGPSNETFNDAQSGNTVDLSKVQAQVTVNLTGGSAIGKVDNNTAASALGFTYTFTTFGTNATVFYGSKTSPTTFYAGSTPDTFEGAPGVVNILSFQDSTGASLTLTIGSALDCSAFATSPSGSDTTYGKAQLGSVGEGFCGMTELDGLPNGTTSFVGAVGSSPVGGYTFRGYGTGNSVSFAALSGTITANLAATPNNTVTFNGSAQKPDILVDITNVTGGSGSGLADRAGDVTGNVFIAGNQQDDTFSVPAGSYGNTINFSNVQTSATSLLTINLTGGPVSGSQSNGTATVSGYLYTFSGTAGAFTTFIGAANGETHFLAGPGQAPPGSTPAALVYNFQASPGTAGNLVDFSAIGDPLSARLDNAQVTWNNGQSITAYLVNLTTVIGSSSASGGDVYTTGTGTYNLTTADGGNNRFNLGPGSVTITDPNPGNTIDFSGVGGPGQLTVNVSGSQLGSIPNDVATGNGSTYTFSNEPTTFYSDSTAPTYFDVGPVNDTFNGIAGVSVTLDYSQISPPGALTICVDANLAGTCKAGSITLGTFQQTFANIKNFVGLASGQTTIVADNSTPGINFTGVGGTNTADFSNAGSPVTINMEAETTPGGATNDVSFGGGGADTITGVSVVYGSASAANTFIAGQSSETFRDSGTGHTDTIDFSNVITSGSSLLTINVPAGVANGNGLAYNFAVGLSNFKIFDGSSDGNTTFLASKNSGNYSFIGQQPGGATSSNNTVSFAANTIGIVANLSGYSVGLLPSGCVVVDGNAADCDTVKGVQYVIGSPSAANTFYGGLNGIEYESTYTTNTLSYLGLPTTNPIYFNEANSTVTAITATPGEQADTYSLPGTLIIQGTGGNDVFRVGSASTQVEGGGGADTLDLGALNGVTVNMQAGTVNGNGGNGQPISGVSWSSSCIGCDPNTLLTIGTILGSQGADTYVLAAGALQPATQSLVIKPGTSAGNTLDLSNIATSATVVMPVATGSKPICSVGSAPTGCGTAMGAGAAGANVVFYGGITNLNGTKVGGDTVFAGTGVENLTESGTTGTLNLSRLPGPAGSTSYTGATITVSDNAGIYQGTVTSSLQVGLTIANITGFNTFVGTNGNDAFIQNGPSPTGGYTFAGGTGTNSVNLSNGQAGTLVTLAATTPADTCGVGADGQVVQGFLTVDQFSCVSSVASTGSTFAVQPGLSVAVNGGGTGTLELMPAPGTTISSTQGAIIDLLAGKVTSAFTGPEAYNFTFSGMSTIQGTTGNDTFVAGPGTYTLIGGGGSDAISYLGAPSAAEVNLSNAPYLIPAGFSGAGSELLAGTAQGGYNGLLTLVNISSVVGTANFNDVLVGASSGVGSMIGGSGNDLFVLTGGFDYITAGSGNSILDLSQLTGITRLNMAASGPQYLGGNADGGVWILSGNIAEIIASPGGSTLLGGAGNLTLQGGTGNDTLVAGSGNQTVIGGGGSDTLIGGSGTDLLEGGAQPVTFQPGSGNDTLTSLTTGNTLSYVNAPNSVTVNLTSSSVAPPPAPPTAPSGGLLVNSPSTALLQTFQNDTVPGMTATGGWGATVNLANAGINIVLGNGTSNLYIVGGNDTVNGGTGNDLFMVGGSNNTLTAGNSTQSVFLFMSGGTGNVINGGGESTVDFSTGTAGVTVNLQAASTSGTAYGGFNGNPSSDNLYGITNIVGTQYNDHLIAGAPGGIIIGDGAVGISSTQGCGANCGDLLQAGPQGGDTLEANTTGSASGNDTFCANAVSGSSAYCVASGTSAGGGDTMIGGSGNDTFFAGSTAGDRILGGGGYNTEFYGPNDPVPSATANQIQNAIKVGS